MPNRLIDGRIPIIFAVDDSQENLELLKLKIEAGGFQFYGCAKGEDALQEIKRLSPDIILMDVNMPYIDGFKLGEKLKNEDVIKEIPLIYLTAMSSKEEIIKGINLGAVDYITKPFNTEEVFLKLRNHIKLIKGHEKIFQIKKMQVVRALVVKLNHEINHTISDSFSSLYKIRKDLDNDHVDTLEKSLIKIVDFVKDISALALSDDEILTEDYGLGSDRMVKIVK